MVQTPLYTIWGTQGYMKTTRNFQQRYNSVLQKPVLRIRVRYTRHNVQHIQLKTRHTAVLKIMDTASETTMMRMGLVTCCVTQKRNMKGRRSMDQIFPQQPVAAASRNFHLSVACPLRTAIE